MSGGARAQRTSPTTTTASANAPSVSTTAASAAASANASANAAAASAAAPFRADPTIRASGDYVAVALWGDAGNEPTAILMTVHSNATLFSHTSPGSMMAVDVALDASSAATDTVLLNVAGKNVPANVGGTGGDAYVFEITVNKV